MSEYTVVIEDAGDNWSAYVPDLPGCVAVGGSADEALESIREAIALHVDSLHTHGEPVPGPVTRVATVQVA